jgi:hypothetical protein
MASDIDFYNLLACRLFDLGRYTLGVSETGEPQLLKRDVPLFDARLNSLPNEISKLHDKEYRTSEAYFGASLARHLDPTVKLPLRTAIINQWAETYEVVNRIPVIPSTVHFAMQPPAAPWKKHNHSMDCKQTLTFCYTFDEHSINNPEPSRFVINNNGIDYSFIYPKDKFYFTFRDNMLHESISNEWRFFWIFDFDQYIDIPDTNFIEMSVNFNK